MSILEQYPVIRTALRATQIIVFALFMGVVLFLGVASFLVVTGRVEPAEPPLITYVLIVAGVLTISGVAVVRSILLRQTREAALRGDAATLKTAGGAELQEAGPVGRLFQGWQMSTILMAAAIEGAALMCAVAAIVEGLPWAIAVGGLFACLLLLYVPTTARLEHYLEAEMLEIESARARG